MNAFSVLERSARVFEHKSAIIAPAPPDSKIGDHTITYRELHDAASRFSGELKYRGVRKGNRVAIFLPNVPEYAVAVYAAWRIGAVPVLLSTTMKSDEIKEYISLFEPRVVITLDKPLCEEDVLYDTIPPQQICAVTFYPTFPRDPAPFRDLNPSDPALILLTSGTTGKRKGAVLTHGNIISNINATVHYTGMRPDDVTICFLPLFHCFGQNFIMNATLMAGATTMLHKRYVHNEVLESVRANNVSMFFHVPVGYEKLLGINDIGPFASVRYFFSAGAPLKPETAKTWHEKFGRKIFIGYGLTESTPFATYNADPESEYRYDSVGEPIENVEVRLVDKNGRRIKRDYVRGRVIIRGPNVFAGYYKNPKATREALRDGWLYTSDIGVWDRGHLKIVDRADDMIKVCGFAVWPAVIENVMLRHYGNQLREIAVIGCPNKERGEIPCAFVVPSDQTLTANDIIKMSQRVLSGYEVIRNVQFVDELPKNAKGTALKHVLKEVLRKIMEPSPKPLAEEEEKEGRLL